VWLAARAATDCRRHSRDSAFSVGFDRPGAPSPTDADPRDTLPYLASDRLQGRGVGQEGLDDAANFIAAEFASDGLRPLPGNSDFFQPFPYTVQSSPGPRTSLLIGSQPLALNSDYIPMRFSSQGKFSGPVVFAGYGVSDSRYDDYAGIDVKGKVVIALRYEPMDGSWHSRLAPQDDPSGWSEHATFATKAKTAAEHGAAALLIVNVPDSEPDLLTNFSSATAEPASIPVIQIKESVADQLLTGNGSPNLKTLWNQINSAFKPRSMLLTGGNVSGEVQIAAKETQLNNVIGVLPGEGPLADQFIIVGAHYDHLGLGQLGYTLGPPGSIYHGADDNASGTSTILELASRFSHGPAPARSIVFICFTAEEEGLIGSEYFVKRPPIPLDKIVAMVNLDMVGRIRDETLYIGGQGTAKDFDSIVTQADSDSPLKLKSIGRGGLGPSDHMSFALKHIPVLFLFSGLHADYHRPTDTSDKINYAGIDEVADFTARVINGLTQMPRDPYVVEADKDSMHLFGMPMMGGGPARRVILGVIPDYSSADSRVGVLISGTTPGTPAEAAGLQEGDLLVQFNQEQLQNLMDLTQDLARSKPGDKIVLKLIRGTKTLSFNITLAERKD
jgi:hypothetical protein